MDGIVTSFQTIWQAVRNSIKGRVIRPQNPDGPSSTLVVSVRDEFFNDQPELRNRRRDIPKYPGLLLTVGTPTRSPNLIVQEWQKQEVEVESAAPYLVSSEFTSVELSDGETVELTIGRRNSLNVETLSITTVTFTNSDFDSITAASPLELAAVLQSNLIGICKVTVEDDRITILHNDSGSRASLQVTGGSSTNFRDLFPTYKVNGRDAGTEIRYVLPPVYYNCPFQITHKSARFDHYNLLHALTTQLFMFPLAKGNKYLVIANKPFEVVEERPFDAHVPSE